MSTCRSTPDPARSLSDLEQRIIDFERSWFKHAGAKDSVIHRDFAMTPTRYYQLLNVLIENPAAEAYDPMGIRRLRRLRHVRRSAREASAAR